MTFDSKIAMALAFTTAGRPLLGFEYYPVKEIPEDSDDKDSDIITVVCNEEDARAYGVYAILRDGDLEITEWIADLTDKESAVRLTDLLRTIRCGAVTPTPRAWSFVNSDFERLVDNMNSGDTFEYSIVNNVPLNYELSISGPDGDSWFDYSNLLDAGKDVMIAAKHLGINFIDISDALPREDLFNQLTNILYR